MSRYLVVGMKRWKGTLEGKAIDSAKVFVQVKIDDTRNADVENQHGSGMATEELRLPGGQHLLNLETRPLPFWADISSERVSNGKMARDVVTGIRWAAAYQPGVDAESGVVDAPAPSAAPVVAPPVAAPLRRA